ncbi:venom allergen 5-like [Varroa destructor]|uniref:SCP domain-containing protein n=1 Tax=Varroa destructor TaxID=109461 RepID=A0A7M7K194_VARDE|nr:venom allergen 5-like [Varroa destructor]XP_022659921.1 venom allergen 5-like [Varroa destructor]
MLLLVYAMLSFMCFVNTKDLCTSEVRQYCYLQKRHPMACVGTYVCPQISENQSDEEERFKENIVRLHNVIRSQPVYGLTAANMRQLKWDDQLEQMAKITAHQICVNTYIQRFCEATPKHLEMIGSNELVLSANFKLRINADTVMDKWFKKRMEYNATNLILPFNGNRSIQPVAQILSAETHSIGCAYLQANNRGLQLLVVCKYAPAGANVGMNAFIVGPQGSQCPVNTSRTPEGLCN